MYKVIKHFTDLHDKDYPYNLGETFPRDGVMITEKRLEELAGSENKQGTPLIKLVEESEAVEELEAVEESEVVEKVAAKSKAKKAVIE